MPDGDDPANPDNRDGWEGVDEYTTEVTLPDGSTVTQASDGKGGPTKNTLRDSDGKIRETWDADDIQFDESDTSADIIERFRKTRSGLAEGAGTPSSPEFPLFNNPYAEALAGNQRDTDAKEPLLQRYWRRIREGKDPGPDPRTPGDTEFPDDYVIQDSIVSEEAMSWFRRGPVMIPILIIAGTLVIVVSVNLFTSDDEVPKAVSDVSDEPLPGLDDDIEPEPAPASETETEPDSEAETAVETATGEEPDDVATESDESGNSGVPVMSGTRLIAGAIDTECGGQYDVTLRQRRFDNQEETVEQTFTLGGNAMQSAAGWGNDNVSFLSTSEAGFYEVWFFIWNLGEILSILNVYGTSASFTAPESAADVAAWENVRSASDLLIAVNGSVDSCASKLEISGVETKAFPAASG